MRAVTAGANRDRAASAAACARLSTTTPGADEWPKPCGVRGRASIGSARAGEDAHNYCVNAQTPVRLTSESLSARVTATSYSASWVNAVRGK